MEAIQDGSNRQYGSNQLIRGWASIPNSEMS